MTLVHDLNHQPRPGFLAQIEVRVLAAVVLGCGLALALTFLQIPLPAEIRIAAGFFLFFTAPGLLFIFTFFPGQRPHYLEIYPAAIALSMGVWAGPGLLSYFFDLRLGAVAALELSILLALAAALAVRARIWPAAKDPDPADAAAPGHSIIIITTALLIAALAYKIGAFRGLVIDWDYFNYISHVNKLVAWDHASIHHFAYADAPPDPIHSYNLWALQWSLISKLYRISAVELYIKSAFLTAPAAALAVYSLARRVFNADVARTALLLFAVHQTVFGGMLFLGLTTFFPADSQWLLVFPAAVALFLHHQEAPKSPGLALGVALAALGMSITHVLWGLGFYLVMAAAALVAFLRQYRLKSAWTAARNLGFRASVIAVAAWFAVPLVFALVKAGTMLASRQFDGRAPLLGQDPGLAPWPYFIIFGAVPLVLAPLLLLRLRRAEETGGFNELGRALTMIAICLFLALPYAWLRYEAIQATNWTQFGRNPYQAFITSTLFFLNPFQRSLQDPNMTFYPLYILGYAGLPLLWLRAEKFPRAIIVLVILIAVPLICFHPAIATVFAHLFSLGYLRRLLRLVGLLSYLPIALGLHLIVKLFRDHYAHPLQNLALTLAAAAAISGACLFFKTDPPYFHDIPDKTIYITKNFPRDSLLADDTVFRVIAEHQWFAPDAVLFSDLWTSFRLTAYLPQFVAAQHKPGVGVPDQDRRMELLFEFFDQRSSVARMTEILDALHVDGVIVNRDPSYYMGSIPCSFPEVITRLKSDPGRFQLLYDRGDWAVFRVVRPAVYK